jgi:hypothetical protein
VRDAVGIVAGVASALAAAGAFIIESSHFRRSRHGVVLHADGVPPDGGAVSAPQRTLQIGAEAGGAALRHATGTAPGAGADEGGAGGVAAWALPEPPAQSLALGRVAGGCGGSGVEPRRHAPDGRLVRHSVSPLADGQPTRGRKRRRFLQGSGGIGGCGAGGAGALHAGAVRPPCARRCQGRCINIHHSFLPSFKGRAALSPGTCTRGVKLVGRCDSALRHQVTWTKARSSSRTACELGTAWMPMRWCAYRQGRRERGVGAGGALACGAPRAAQRVAHRGVPSGRCLTADNLARLLLHACGQLVANVEANESAAVFQSTAALLFVRITSSGR